MSASARAAASIDDMRSWASTTSYTAPGPRNYDEVVLTVDKNNEVRTFVLYSLGLRT